MADTYWLVDSRTGEGLTVDGDTVERVVGVEISVVSWAIAVDGQFENGWWRVAPHDDAIIRDDCGDFRRRPNGR